jgi:hypothetical protein
MRQRPLSKPVTLQPVFVTLAPPRDFSAHALGRGGGGRYATFATLYCVMPHVREGHNFLDWRKQLVLASNPICRIWRGDRADIVTGGPQGLHRVVEVIEHVVAFAGADHQYGVGLTPARVRVGDSERSCWNTLADQGAALGQDVVLTVTAGWVQFPKVGRVPFGPNGSIYVDVDLLEHGHKVG